MTQSSSFRFDFAISYAGAQRELASKINSQLTEAGLRVFYDQNYEPELVGEDGGVRLRTLYSVEARFYIVLVSKAYDKKPWTILEREAIEARESVEAHTVLFPIIVKGHRPKWLDPERIFFELRDNDSSFEELINTLKRKGVSDQESFSDPLLLPSQCQVALPSISANPFMNEIEGKLKQAGFQLTPNDGPSDSAPGPWIKCMREDRLVALKIKAIIDTVLVHHTKKLGFLDKVINFARSEKISSKGEIEGMSKIALRDEEEPEGVRHGKLIVDL